MRYAAIDNTNAAAYAGWEVVDTQSVPAKTIGIGMPEFEAKLCAVLFNKNDIDNARIVDLAMKLDHYRQLLRTLLEEAESLASRGFDGWGPVEEEPIFDMVRNALK